MLIIADLEVVKRADYFWYFFFHFKRMGDSEHINETVETIAMLTVSAIEQLKKKQKRI